MFAVAFALACAPCRPLFSRFSYQRGVSACQHAPRATRQHPNLCPNPAGGSGGGNGGGSATRSRTAHTMAAAMKQEEGGAMDGQPSLTWRSLGTPGKSCAAGMSCAVALLACSSTPGDALGPAATPALPCCHAASELRLEWTLPTGQSFRWRQTGSEPIEFTGMVGQRAVRGSGGEGRGAGQGGAGDYGACRAGPALSNSTSTQTCAACASHAGAPAPAGRRCAVPGDCTRRHHPGGQPPCVWSWLSCRHR